MRIALLTKEYPPNIYGGAGVHVEYLSRELARLFDVDVLCFGDQAVREGRLSVRGLCAPPEAKGSVLEAPAIDIAMTAAARDADVVHTHTWYAAFAGYLARALHGRRHVMTIHSLEPLRPWKADQLGGGYEVSSLVERAAIESAHAVIAVSEEGRRDVLRCYPAVRPERVHVVHNGIDLDEWRPVDDREPIARRGVDPDAPFVLFVGRATPQKGLLHFLEAAREVDPRAQVVVLAGAADTLEYAARVREAAERLTAARPGVRVIEEMVPRAELRAFYTRCSLYCCPSIYEPFGIVNLEAMACEAPVVATRTGGIPEIVVEGETGFLVDPPGEGEEGARRFERDLAARMSAIVADAALRARMGAAGRKRAAERFSWRAIAERTVAVYERALA